MNRNPLAAFFYYIFIKRVRVLRRSRINERRPVSLLAVCKYGLVDTFPGFKILHVITPPIMDGFRMVGKTDVFDKAGSLKIFAHMLIFTAAAVIIKIKLLCYNMWRV